LAGFPQLILALFHNLDIPKAQVNPIGLEDNPLQGHVKLAHKGA
jgi:hypothetical protein